MTDLIETGRDYSRFYAPAIYLALQDEKAVVIPAHTEQDPNDPINGVMVFLAGEGHRWSAMLDLVAVNQYPAGATRRSAFVALARTVGQRLQRPSPAAVDVVAEIIGNPGVTDAVIPNGAFVTTDNDAVNESVPFEYLGADVLADTEVFRVVGSDAGVLGSVGLGSVVDYGGATTEVNDALYVGHPTRLFNGLRIETTVTMGTAPRSVWERSDGSYTQLTPDTVLISGVGLQFSLDAAFGLSSPFPNHTGLQITIRHRDTGVSETVLVSYSAGSNRITTGSALGQVSPSINVSDYIVTAEWLPFTADVTETSTTVLEVTFEIFESVSTRWGNVQVSGQDGYWVRYRTTTLVGPTPPSGTFTVAIEDFLWSVRATFTQGETVTAEDLGVTNGTAFQALSLARSAEFIENSLGTMLIGTDPDWGVTENILESDADDKSFELVERNDGILFVRFGDGINGRIPPSSEVVKLTYRANADDNGNVGATVVVNGGAGTEFLSGITNPRPASGWTPLEADESDTSGLSFARARRDIPARVRSSGKIHTGEDAETEIIKRFVTADGRAPFERIIVRELGFGYRVSKAIVVGGGDAVPSQADLDELDTWLNGIEAGIQRFGGEAPGGKRIRPVAYQKNVLALVPTITVLKRYEGGAEALARAALIAELRPTAVDSDGVFLWEPGQEISVDRVKAIFSAAVKGYFSSTFLAFTGVTLGETELPDLDVASLNVKIVGIIT